MEFDDVKEALGWYVVRSDENYSDLKALRIGLDCGISISPNKDVFDDIDTLHDIENIIKKSLSKFEIDIILRHIKYGKDDLVINGEIIKGGFSSFKRKIENKKNRTVYTSVYYNFIRAIFNQVERSLKKSGYIK